MPPITTAGAFTTTVKLKTLLEGNLFNPALGLDIAKLPPELIGVITQEIINTLPAAATSLKDELAANIPIARDGAVVTPDYHNALRSAVLRLAEGGGSGPTLTSRTVTLAPAFNPIWVDGTKQPEWTNQGGIAFRPPAPAAGCDGWMPVQLPDGYRVESVTVTGKRTGGTTFGAAGLKVQVLSQKLTESASTVLFERNVGDTAGDPFTLKAVKQVNDDELAVNAAARKYSLRATLTGASADAVAGLFAFQVVCVAV